MHGIRDISVLPGATVLAMAYRLPAYQGVMRERLHAQLLTEAASEPDGPAAPPGQPEAKAIPVTPATVAADPVMSQIFSFG